MSSLQQFCTFLLDGNTFGVPVPAVQEVIQFQEMTPVPLAPAVVSGMINLRGQIVTAIDLRRRMGLGERSDGQLPLNVIVRTGDEAVSLLVDEIGDVIEVGEEVRETPPETLGGASRRMIHGVYKLPDRLLLTLNIDRIVDLEDLRSTAGHSTQA